MSDLFDRSPLKQQLLEAMSGPGGAPEFFYALRDLMEEMAADQRNIRQDEEKAQIWDGLARAMNRAAGKSIPLLEVL
jgi:hypothetical protein